MAFDKPTRNALSRMVADCRRLLTNDVREQLQATYGIQPDGTALAVDKLAYLDDRGLEIATALREWLEHLCASEAGTEEQRRTNAFFRMAQETAFTYLNRLAALRMCEERGLVIECVRRGTESDGFALYERLASQLLGDRGQTYRVFLECMFDELAIDLGVLFECRVPHSLVFPTPACIAGVIQRLNDKELAHLWQEDEAIGWLYQYFNSREEIDRMRKKELGGSPSPRNSRELAVRNQFFTPRYVVEFLTDNTLGRLWYEMLQGETVLKDECSYLIRRPNEIFLGPKEQPPETEYVGEDISQEELLKYPVYLPYRVKKDPRDLKILDPACGSGHFLLYAFDLLEDIYIEAWQNEAASTSENKGKPLRDDYETEQSLRKDIPALILQYNLHGIDIDPRACQIASLSLWLRAQRSYQKIGLKAADRPTITKSNIVCAEPMPGKEELLEEFISQELNGTPEKEAIAYFVQQVFDKMKLAGEAGSLLRIEEDISEELTNARKQWAKQFERARDKKGHDLLFSAVEMDRLSGDNQQHFDFSDITDADFWNQAEKRIVEALQHFAEHAANGESLKRGLFRDDAAQGFAFIDLCRNQYDVVLMNPPFGVPSSRAAHTLAESDAGNLYPAFIRRAIHLGASHVGCISDRTFTTQATFAGFRSAILQGQTTLSTLVDLGWGVLDANVQVAMYTMSRPMLDHIFCADLQNDDDKLTFLSSENKPWRLLPRKAFLRLPAAILAYNLPSAVLGLTERSSALADIAVLPRGLGSNKAARTYAFWAEVPATELSPTRRWEPLANGGDFSPFHRQDLGVADWRMPSGRLWVEIKASEGWRPYDQSKTSDYFRCGLSFPKQSSAFNAAILPTGFLPTREGKAILPVPDDKETIWFLLALMNSGPVRAFVRDTCGLHKQSGAIGRIPIPSCSHEDRAIIGNAAKAIWQDVFGSFHFDETSRWFVMPAALVDGSDKLLNAYRQTVAYNLQIIDDACRRIYRVEAHNDWVEKPARPELFVPHEADLLSWVVGTVFGRFDVRFRAFSELITVAISPFARPPACSPGMLLSSKGVPATRNAIAAETCLQNRLNARTVQKAAMDMVDEIGAEEYPIRVAWDGVLVNDNGLRGEKPHTKDLVRLMSEVFEYIWEQKSFEKEQELCQLLGISSLRDYVERSTGFFEDHLQKYTQARRTAPIYWPLSTSSGSYSVWLYYHRLTDQTLYTIVNQYLEPKIEDVQRVLTLIEEALPDTLGVDATRLRDELHKLRDLLSELLDMKQELLRVAALPYKPDLNDGVIINAAPLHKLFRHRAWAKACEDCWKELEKGDYDWTHMAYNIWPDRVRESCKKDRSLAIAHGLEDICAVPLPEEKKKRKSLKSKA